MNQKKRNRLIKLSKIIIKMLNKLSYLKFVSFQKKKKTRDPRINIIFHHNHWTTSFLLNIVSNSRRGFHPWDKSLVSCQTSFRLHTSSCLRRQPFNRSWTSRRCPTTVRSPQSRRSSKGATNNFLPLKTFTQPELNSSKLAASKVSILDKCSSVVYMLCIVRNGWRTDGCLDTGNILSGRKTGKKRKMRKKLPRNLVSLFRANEFRLHVNLETGDGDSFRRDFSDWFSGLPRGRNYFAFTV